MLRRNLYDLRCPDRKVGIRGNGAVKRDFLGYQGALNHMRLAILRVGVNTDMPNNTSGLL